MNELSEVAGAGAAAVMSDARSSKRSETAVATSKTQTPSSVVAAAAAWVKACRVFSETPSSAWIVNIGRRVDG